MPWRESFNDLLRSGIGPTTRGQVYAPKFRLQMGTGLIAGKHMGQWEKKKGGRCLEISSHPNSSSTGLGTLYRRSTTDLGFPYLYCVGLTDQMSFGKQSIDPRTFAYTGMTMNVGVTRFAAALAAEMPIGTLCCMQIYIDPMDDTITGLSAEEVPDYENIFIGSYRGLTYNGDTYTLTFVDALQQCKYHSTFPGVENGSVKAGFRYIPSASLDKEHGFWFWGVGRTTLLKEGSTDYTDTSLKLTLEFDRQFREGSAFGFTGKRRDCYKPAFGWTGVPLVGPDATETARSHWAKIKVSTDGDDSWVHYEVTGAYAGGEMALNKADSHVGFAKHLPGFNGMSAQEVGDGFSINSEVTPVCVISGTPVTELVNTLYVAGYDTFMVPGLFGVLSDMYRPDMVNFEDVDAAHAKFDNQYRSDLALLSSSPSPGSKVNDPCMRFVVSQPVQDGYSLMTKSAGKWGVFPRFKKGGYGIGVYDHDRSRIRADVPPENVLDLSDITFFEMQLPHSQMLQSYRTGKIVSTAKDNGFDGEEVEVKQTSLSSVDFDSSWVALDTQPRTAPTLPELKVTTSDCAEGGDGCALNYREYIKRIQRILYSVKHTAATIRLRGFRYANLAPGDRIDIVETISSLVSTTPYHFGPTDAKMRGSMLTTIQNIFSGATTRQQEPWLVVSTQCDWLRCNVTIEVVRANERETDADKEWDSRLDEQATRAESLAMGMVIPKKPK